MEGRILIADDWRFLRRLYRSILAGKFPTLQIDEVSSGSELVDRATAQAYAVIISDNDMLGGTGLEALRALRSQGNATPFYMVSSDDEKSAQVMAAGAQGFLLKPFRNRELID